MPRGSAPDSQQVSCRRPLLVLLSVLTLALAVGSARVSASEAGGSGSNPVGIAIAADRAYVLERGSGRIVIRSLDGSELSSFGSSGRGPGQLADASAIAAGRDGRLYVAEEGNHRVSIFSSSGRFLSSFGSFARSPRRGHFDAPRALAVGPVGNVYVADRGGTVQVFTPDGKFLRWWGRREQDMRSGSWLREPSAVAVDAQSRVYVADALTSDIRVFSSNGQLLSRLGPMIGGSWKLDAPSGLAVDRGQLFLADSYRHEPRRSGNERVLRLRAGAVLRGSVLGSYGRPCSAHCAQGTGGRAAGELSAPQGVAVQDGRVYVADAANDRVQVFSLAGQLLAVW